MMKFLRKMIEWTFEQPTGHGDWLGGPDYEFGDENEINAKAKSENGQSAPLQQSIVLPIQFAPITQKVD